MRNLKTQGFTVLFTGYSGAGKTTLATLLSKALEEVGRTTTLLDGDQVRRHLSGDLGFSREHRDINLRRIGFVATEVSRHGGAAICSPIAPYDGARKEFRAMVDRVGGFVLIFVSTSLAVCEGRDPKGLYALARAGKLLNFTGVSDPYEPPTDAEIDLDMAKMKPKEGVGRIMSLLQQRGYLE